MCRRLLPSIPFAALIALAGCIPPASCSADFACNPILAALLFPKARVTYVAAGSGCTEWQSTDGMNWTARTDAFAGCTTGTITGIAHGGQSFVAVGAADGATCGIWVGRVYQEQTIRWTRVSCPLSAALLAVSFGTSGSAGEFTAGGMCSAGTYGMVSSTDGMNWTDQSFAAACTTNVSRMDYIPVANKFVMMPATAVQSLFLRPLSGSWATSPAATGWGTNPLDLAVGETVTGTVPRVFVAGKGGGTVLRVTAFDDTLAATPIHSSPDPLGGPNINFAVVLPGPGRVAALGEICIADQADAGGLAYGGTAGTISDCSGVKFRSSLYGGGLYLAGATTGEIYYSLTGAASDWRPAVISPSNTAQIWDFAYRSRFTGLEYYGP